MKWVLLLGSLFAVAGCGRETRVRVDRQLGMDGAWQVPAERAPSLDATGKQVTLRFQGRFFVFEIEKFRGFLDEKEVMLQGDGLKIDLTAERVRVESREGTVEKPLAELPKSRRIVYRNHDFVVE